MNLKEPFENEQIIKRQKNGIWTVFQYCPFQSSINKRILFTARSEDKAILAFNLLEVWQKTIQEKRSK